MIKSTVIVIISIALLMGGLAACSSGGGSDEDNTYILTPDIEDIPTAIIIDEDTADDPATETTATPTVEPVAIAEPDPEIPDLYLEITSPSNESIVKTSSVEVTGNTIPTAIVSVNGILTSVNADGEFTATTTLEDGANFIEIVSSDIEGEELGEVLTVVYLSS